MKNPPDSHTLIVRNMVPNQQVPGKIGFAKVLRPPIYERSRLSISIEQRQLLGTCGFWDMFPTSGSTRRY